MKNGKDGCLLGRAYTNIRNSGWGPYLGYTLNLDSKSLQLRQFEKAHLSYIILTDQKKHIISWEETNISFDIEFQKALIT